MGLTKPRAAQIYDIDYKQATRVLTTSNITLSGGAPSQVDGVNLSLDDRVLVIGQLTQSQNGIYFVDMLGTGSNGTWVRTGDTDITGELLAGTIVMVTEGIVYHDTQWKLTTDDPIIIGTTPLVFEQNSAFAFGNVYANNTAVLATSVGDVLTLSAGNNISIIGNNTSKSVTIGVTGISLTSIANGTSNVNVVSSGGNVTIGVGGTSNVAVFSSGGLAITGNITGGNILTSGQLISTQTGSSSTGAGQVYLNGATNNRIDWNTEGVAAPAFTTRSAGTKLLMYPAISDSQVDYAMGINAATLWSSVPLNSPDFYFKWYGGQTEVASLGGAGAFSVAGNITAVGNITGGNILGNGAGLTGINAFSNITVTGGNSAVADSIADTLTLTAGTGISIVVDPATDTITIGTQSGSELFVDGADFGTVTEPVTLSDDLGLVTEAVTQESDLGTLVLSGLIYPDQFVLPSYTTSTLPSASVPGAMIYVTNETGGPVPAFADGTNWRRVTDRAIVT
jgi:hypothetical protein